MSTDLKMEEQLRRELADTQLELTLVRRKLLQAVEQIRGLHAERSAERAATELRDDDAIIERALSSPVGTTVDRDVPPTVPPTAEFW